VRGFDYWKLCHLFVSVSCDRQIALWDYLHCEKGALPSLYSIQSEHKDFVNCCIITENFLVTGSSDKSIIVSEIKLN